MNKEQCSERIHTGRDLAHPCTFQATVFEYSKWWCSRHSEAALLKRQEAASQRAGLILAKENRAPRLLETLREIERLARRAIDETK